MKEELKEYKDFTTITNIRRLTQEAINPVVASIQGQMNQLIHDNQDLRKNLIKIDQVFEVQGDLKKRMDDYFKLIQQFKDQDNNKQRDQERRSVKMENANQKLLLEIHTMKEQIKYQNQSIEIMKTKNEKVSAIYSTLDSRNETAIKTMQEKYMAFTSSMLEESKVMKGLYQKNQSEVQVISEVFKRQRKILEQKQQGLELFFRERQSMHKKFEDLYSKIIDNVSRSEFEGFRKSQIKFLQNKQEEIDNQILKVLPMQLRQQLPLIQIKLKQIDKIRPLISRLNIVEEKITELSNKFYKNLTQNQNSFAKIEKTIKNQISLVNNKVQQKLKAIKQDMQNRDKEINARVGTLKQTIQEEMQEIMERQTSQIHKTIQDQISRKKQTLDQDRDIELKEQILQIREIKQKLLDRANQLEELGESLDLKLNSYSNKITRIKSDYELFADGIRKEISGVIKFRKGFKQNLQDIGGLLSQVAQMLMVNGSLHYENIMGNNKSDQAQQHQIFVTNADGIIYEFKGTNKNNTMLYRRQRLEKKQFIKSYMYSMATFFDQIFQSCPFLAWNDKKPSAFFKQRFLDNYQLRIAKNLENKNLKNNINWNNDRQKSETENQIQGAENTLFEFNTNNMPKSFSRTLQSRVGAAITRNQKNQNEPEKASQLKKTYSIKKPRTSAQKTRYDQCFFSSRSNCRSRISQAS